MASRLSIGLRIGAGFAAIIAIGMGVAGVALYQLGDIGRTITTMDVQAANVGRVLRTNNALEALRGLELRNSIDPDSATVQQIVDKATAAEALMREAERSSQSADRRRIYHELTDSLQRHRTTVEEGTQRVREAVAARAKLFTGGDELTLAADNLLRASASADDKVRAFAGHLERAVLLVRVSNWRYIATGDPAGVATFQKNYAAAIAIIDGADAEQQAASIAVRSKLIAYAAGFTAYSTAHIQVEAVLNSRQRPEILAMQQSLKSASDSIDAAYEAATVGTEALVATTSSRIEALTGISLAIGVLLAVLIGRGISRPVRMMTVAMRRLADRDMSVAIPGLGRRDEIGAMASAVQVFKNNALEAQKLAQEQAAAAGHRAAEDDAVRAKAEQDAAAEAATLVVGSIGEGLARLAAGDLTYRLEKPLPAAYEALRNNLNAAMDQLRGVVQGIITSTGALRSGTGEVAQAADDLSRRTEQQAASLEQTAAALDEITATVQKTAEGAKHAQTVASNTRTDAEQSGNVVKQAVAAMASIETSSREITQIIGTIDEIAFQTNLLALNAGVEAARAGDAGRGFAVVASEVRALAQRSAEAAKEIKALISTSAKHVSSGVSLVGQTGDALVRIVTQVNDMTGVVAAIAASAQEQAAGLGQVNTAINQMDQVTQQNAAMVEESTAASHSLAADTEELARLTAMFQIGAQPDTASATNVHALRRSAAPKPRPVKSAPPRRAAQASGNAAMKAAADPAEGWEEF